MCCLVVNVGLSKMSTDFKFLRALSLFLINYHKALLDMMLPWLYQSENEYKIKMPFLGLIAL